MGGKCGRCRKGREVTRILNECAKCPSMRECFDREADNLSNHGRSFVSIDAYPDPDFALGRRKTDVQAQQGEQHTQLPFDVEMRLRDELAGFLRLSFLNQILLVWILRGGTLSEFARMDWLPKRTGKDPAVSGISRQTVSEHVMTLKKSCPRIAGVIQDMIALNDPCGSRKKQKSRKSRKA